MGTYSPRHHSAELYDERLAPRWVTLMHGFGNSQIVFAGTCGNEVAASFAYRDENGLVMGGQMEEGAVPGHGAPLSLTIQGK